MYSLSGDGLSNLEVRALPLGRPPPAPPCCPPSLPVTEGAVLRMDLRPSLTRQFLHDVRPSEQSEDASSCAALRDASPGQCSLCCVSFRWCTRTAFWQVLSRYFVNLCHILALRSRTFASFGMLCSRAGHELPMHVCDPTVPDTRSFSGREWSFCGGGNSLSPRMPRCGLK